MFDNSADVLDDYREVWSPIPIMAPVKNQLDELLQRIQETDNTSQLSSSQITEKKFHSHFNKKSAYQDPYPNSHLVW
ncbi:hypothetical protein [Marinilabilia rubra]|uniref:Uncharacterized protein n=1 Tax=Marinilabilia rubra TaxID=2162893 RepID=A0A2U2B5E3_9BACT|nr:hypothetical protein [Marinilabilia rubra]PWD98253.1 hypothetical protein DDZ16_16610 [Marinilabilia rubra]